MTEYNPKDDPSPYNFEDMGERITTVASLCTVSIMATIIYSQNMDLTYAVDSAMNIWNEALRRMDNNEIETP